MNAVEFGHDDVIKALVECGAHIQVFVLLWQRDLGSKDINS
jgi:hypothetical protein